MRSTFRKAITPLAILALVVATMSAASAQGVVLADRQLDWSNTQGQKGWYYMYCRYDQTNTTYDPARNQLMPTYTSEFQRWESPRDEGDGIAILWGPSSSMAMQCHTNQDQYWYWPVSRWVSNYSGAATISGHVAEINQGVDPEMHNNGEYVWIYIDGVRVKELAVNANDFVGYDYSFGATLNVGSIVEWVQHPIGPGVLLPGEAIGWLIVRVEGKIEAVAGSIECNITLPNFGGDLALSPVRIVTSLGGNTVRTDEVTLTQNPGKHTITLAPGKYDLAFSANKCLRKVVKEVQVNGGGTTQLPVSLGNGDDVDGDNEVTTTDVSTVIKNAQ